MENKKKIIILLVIVNIVTVGILLFTIARQSTGMCSSTDMKDYYNKMQKKLINYSFVAFKNYEVTDELRKSVTFNVSLLELKGIGFDSDEFVSYDGKDKCDLEKTYIRIKYDSNTSKYDFTPFYTCGTDSNI